MNFAVRPEVPLSDFMLDRGSSTDPSRHPDVDYALYSIPAFDAGKPELVKGREIGSPKKNVQTGDVLLSRIVPHIRRSCIVGSHPESQILASGEWIVFRSNKVHAPYLKHFLISDIFHPRFMGTVAGVGGSLLRANPHQVGDITIPLPPLEEQRQIAAILEKADALRRKRKRALDLFDSLTQSVFQEMFGFGKYAEIKLKDAVKTGTIVTYGIVQAGPEFKNGVPYIRTSDLVNGSIAQSELRHTDPNIANRFARSRVEAGEIVMSIRATVGTTAIVPPALHGANLTQGTARIAPGDMVLVEYLLAYLRSEQIQRWLKAQVKGATFLEITLGRLRELPVAVPPAQLQREFAERIAAVRRALASTIAQNDILNGLFVSLQARSFSSQL